MAASIEIFAYLQAWPTHVQWAAVLMLLCRAAGWISLDHLSWLGVCRVGSRATPALSEADTALAAVGRIKDF